MDASFVHLPPSLVVPDDGSDAAQLPDRIHPLHVEYLEKVALEQTFASALCLACVQRYVPVMDGQE